MPTIVDNIEVNLLEELKKFVGSATEARFCVGYLNLRGWNALGALIDRLPANHKDPPCKVLVGMVQPDLPLDEELYSDPHIDRTYLTEQRQKLLREFEKQIVAGVPTRTAQSSMRRLLEQIRNGTVQIKLYTRRPLHAKLYLLSRKDTITPLIAYVGSSNLTYAGLAQQGELNVDVVDQDAAQKLLRWFNERWNDQSAIDIGGELDKMVDASWASECIQKIDNLPYLVFLKVAYHLSEDARLGEREFQVPALFRDVLLDFQVAAVQLAGRLLYRHGGVLLGDVVGLGKTLMATALARLFQEFDDSNTLVICPPNLVSMWEYHLQKYQVTGRVLSLGKVLDEIPYVVRYRTLIIDESHNLRNREGKRYRAILEYIEQNEPRVILLTATPYNKQYGDLSNQIRLFVDEKQSLPVRPERFLQEWRQQGKNEADFRATYQAPVDSLVAFEKSTYPEDWRDLMRLFMVRRTRHFVMRHYAHFDEQSRRHYVMVNNRRYYFPVRRPKTITYRSDGTTGYDRLYNEEVLRVIEQLALPRYGLGGYVQTSLQNVPAGERQILDDLNRAGKRLIGFCRTNLFKRLESSGHTFLQSIERHILRNLITLYALQNGLEVPIGTQDAVRLDTAISDLDDELLESENGNDARRDIDNTLFVLEATAERAPDALYQRLYQKAEEYYNLYRSQFHSRFKWVSAKYFQQTLARDLEQDSKALLALLCKAVPWNTDDEPKLRSLLELVNEQHPYEKIAIFTQFADTAEYLAQFLKDQGVADVECATSATADPVSIARRFSPNANGGLRQGETEVRVLIATDVLSEGQNLQDCHIVVNFDLPWAIIRLIQRAGRVDRIGQTHDTVLVYSFLPADGVEEVIRLRNRLLDRLKQNQEVIGTDESFFGEKAAKALHDLYAERVGVLDDDEDDADVDLTSLALEAWQNASEQHREQAQKLPMQVYAIRPHPEKDDDPQGIISFVRLYRGEERHDMLMRLDKNGNVVSQSLSTLFQRLQCEPNTPNLPDEPELLDVFDLQKKVLQAARAETQSGAGALGTYRNLRRRLYERLSHIVSEGKLRSDLRQQAERLRELLYKYPLRSRAEDAIRQHLHLDISDEQLVQALWQMQEEDRLVRIEVTQEARVEIVCTVGLRSTPS